ncbi:hypothetical protein H9P43_008915 [Blastocladiella emersonii ATCC 22665]|nr:hypothetical protein H9P43_008915 [Blastocladiella emersonii ATCC 22665]
MPNATTQTQGAQAPRVITPSASATAAPAAAPATAAASPVPAASGLRAPAGPRTRTVSGTSVHSNHSYRSNRTSGSARRGGRGGHHHHHHHHHHGHHHHDDDEDGYGSDTSISTVSTLTFELSNTYILPEPFLVFCPFDCEDQTPYASVHPLLDHLLSHHGIKIADVGVVAGVMTTYLDEWARRIHSDAELKAALDAFAETQAAAAAAAAAAAPVVVPEPVAAPVSYAAAASMPPPASLLSAQLGPNGSASSSHGHHRAIAITFGVPQDTWDRDLRAALTKAKLTEVLKLQDKERQTEAHNPRKCLFCKKVAENRTALFRHMFAEHSFNIGLPDNLVYVSHFLDLLSEKLAKLQCLYCERTFKSSAVLRKHMRKKRHFRISPRNHEYDRFYIVNYLEPGKNWETLTNAEKYFESDDENADRRSVYSNALTGTSFPANGSVRSHQSFMTSALGEDEDDAGWSDWADDDDETAAAARDACPCLFCDHVGAGAEACVGHMAAEHAFDLPAVTKDMGLSLYQTIVLINYLRKAALVPRCPRPGCTAAIADLPALAKHVAAHKCLTKLPRPAPEAKMDVSVNLAGTNTFGDEHALRQVAAELRGSLAAAVSEGADAESTEDLPAQWDKVGDTVVTLSGMEGKPEDSFWNDPQYLFPTLDGDPLLSYGVDHDDDEDWDTEPQFMF